MLVDFSDEKKPWMFTLDGLILDGLDGEPKPILVDLSDEKKPWMFTLDGLILFWMLDGGLIARTASFYSECWLQDGGLILF